MEMNQLRNLVTPKLEFLIFRSNAMVYDIAI